MTGPVLENYTFLTAGGGDQEVQSLLAAMRGPLQRFANPPSVAVVGRFSVFVSVGMGLGTRGPGRGPDLNLTPISRNARPMISAGKT